MLVEHDDAQAASDVSDDAVGEDHGAKSEILRAVPLEPVVALDAHDEPLSVEASVAAPDGVHGVVVELAVAHQRLAWALLELVVAHESPVDRPTRSSPWVAT